MFGIDPRTFIVISAAFGALCSIVLFTLHFYFPKDIKGLDCWGWGTAGMATAAVLFALRGTIPFVLSSWVANLLVAAGVGVMHSGLRNFSGAPRQDKRIAVILIFTALALVWTTFVHSDYQARILIMSGSLTLLYGACGLTIMRMTGKDITERFTQCLFLAVATIMFARFIFALNQDKSLTMETDTTPIHQLYIATFLFSIIALSLGFILMVHRALHRKLEQLALYDQLTGAFRRDAFLNRLGSEIAQSARLNRPLAVLMVDIDNFKAVNDRHGHTVGDHVIRDFSDKLKQAVRRCDCVCRYGGEEFSVLLPYTEQADAQDVAERIRVAAAQKMRADIPEYTVSIGLALLSPTENNASALIDAADRAMYAAKQAGKNRIEIAFGAS